ncbi:MAG: hypothetical protein KatS3mg104_0185 [Phycisphaerae bacterium]|jgi:hypothetical protein|nr:MAG: hypothetical protein KatS3mg104_0185 [Phycisphaerae bacterium]
MKPILYDAALNDRICVGFAWHVTYRIIHTGLVLLIWEASPMREGV